MSLNLKGAMAAIRAFQEARRGNVVSTTEIVNRGSICAKCPKRVPTTGVSTVSAVLGRMANKHLVPKDVSQYSCGVCGCSLMLLLPASEENIHKDTAEERTQRPEQCWLLKL